MWRYQWPRAHRLWITCFLLSVTNVNQRTSHGQYEDRQARLAKVEKTFGDPPNLKRLAEKDRIWVDVKKHLVVVDGYVAIRNGQLEMFACPAGTKEHESVVGLFSKAKYVHTALLAAGARTGKPVQWEPKFEPPSGSEIEIYALWFDNEGKKQAIDARKWVRQLGKDTLQVNWVFAGSSLWKDPDTGEERYMAESGDMVCLSNFTTAMLDIPIQSSQANSGLLFVANTDRIPPEGTPVRLVFKVVKPAAETGTAAGAAKSTTNPSQDSLELLTPSTKPTELKSTQSKSIEPKATP
jgi:hypothetical protein